MYPSDSDKHFEITKHIITKLKSKFFGVNHPLDITTIVIQDYHFYKLISLVII